MHAVARLLASVWLRRTTRLLLAAAFLAAGTIKLADVHAFSLTVKAFAILPSEAVLPVAVALPVLEILAGLLALLNVRLGLHCIAGLLLLFIGVAGNAIRQGLAIDCGCYGPGDPEGDVYHGLWPTLWRDLAMLAGTVVCLARHRASLSPTPSPTKEIPCATPLRP